MVGVQWDHGRAGWCEHLPEQLLGESIEFPERVGAQQHEQDHLFLTRFSPSRSPCSNYGLGVGHIPTFRTLKAVRHSS
jgi:hypothetical protein